MDLIARIGIFMIMLVFIFRMAMIEYDNFVMNKKIESILKAIDESLKTIDESLKTIDESNKEG